MSAAREGKDVWFLLFGYWPSGKWRGWVLFTRRFWRYREYLWHDSFGKYWARLVTCRFFGHIKLRNVNDPNEPVRMYCFRCERDQP